MFLIESENETLEDSDEWVFSEDSDRLDSDDEETSDSRFEYNEDSGERVEEDANRFKIHNGSNFPDWERIETKDDKIAIERGKKNSGNISG